MKCTMHPHTSELSARRCYDKRLSRSVKRKESITIPDVGTYIQVKHLPPKTVEREGVLYYIFFEGKRK